MAHTEYQEIWALIETIDTLLGPHGCPWDRDQTLLSLKKSVLEEVCEVIDAIHEGKSEEIADELGDLIINCIFLAKVAEKEKHCVWLEPFTKAKEKLVRRHPHIFAKEKPAVTTSEEVIKQWEEIKKEEKKGWERSSVEDGIPVSLPGIVRLQKLYERIQKKPELQARFQNWKEQGVQKQDLHRDLKNAILNEVETAQTKDIQLEECARDLFHEIVKGIALQE